MKALAVALGLAAILVGQPAWPQGADGRISVLGRGVVERAPEQAAVQIGVSNRGTTPTATMDANSAAAARVIAFAKRFGVEARDIRTSSVRLSESFRTITDPSGRSRQEPDGYAASNTVTVTLRDIARLGAFMREAVGEGANRISGVTFGLNDPAAAGDAARLEALEDANRKAALLAQKAQVKLGRIVRIEHPPRADYRSGGGEADLPRRAAAGMNVPIEAGLIEVTAEVDVTWVTE